MHGLVVVVETDRHRDRTEDLVLRDGPLVVDVAQQRRFEEVTLRRLRRAPASGDQRSAVAERAAHVALGALDRDRPDQWPHLRAPVGRVADAESPEEVGDALVVLAEHGRMNEVPRGQCATLTGVEREALHTQLRSLVEIGIGADDHRRLAAELEDYPLQGRCRLGRNGGADGVGPREGDQVTTSGAVDSW